MFATIDDWVGGNRNINEEKDNNMGIGKEGQKQKMDWKENEKKYTYIRNLIGIVTWIVLYSTTD